jgi:uncharacterized protein YkwD
VIRGRGLRRSALAVSLTAALTIGFVAGAPSAGARSPESKLLRLVNGVRTRHGLHTLRMNARLSEDAERHTRRMIRQGQLFDPPNLAQLLRPYDWKRVGASVSGCNGTLKGLVRAWMAHGQHRDILLLPGLRRAGVGVVFEGGKSACGHDQFWATGIVYG